MDPVSRDLDRKTMDPRPKKEATADLETRMGDMQVGGGDDMLIDDYDVVDEKTDAAIITPPDSNDEPTEPQADDCTSIRPLCGLRANEDPDEAMKEQVLPLLPDLEPEFEATSTWHIENYRSMTRKERGPKFQCGDHPWYVARAMLRAGSSKKPY